MHFNQNESDDLQTNKRLHSGKNGKAALDDQGASQNQANPYSQPSYRYYVLAILTVVYAVNLLDRNLLIILQEPIKNEFGLSDTQLGLMTGVAFAVFYTLCGIPIARWADNGNRRSIISIAVALWSLMTVLSGLAMSYTHLLLARIGVGVGEAGGSPPAHSIISDAFSPERRATAISIYSTGIYLGVLCGFLLGGWLAENLGWRMAFVCVGAPGLVLALIVRFTVKEPARSSKAEDETGDEAMSFSEALKTLWRQRAFRHLAIAISLQGFVASATLSWLPPHFLRSFEISIGELGMHLAFASGTAGITGSIASGWLSDQLARRSRAWYLLVPALATVCGLPLFLILLTTGSYELAMILVAITTFFGAMHIGPAVAITHEIVGPRSRAMSSAVLFLVLNLIGTGLGPTVVGILSDYLAGVEVPSPLQKALIVGGVTAGVWSLAHYLIGALLLRGRPDTQREG